MKKSVRGAFAVLLMLAMCASCAITSSAADEPTIYYFVDCGDYLVDTVSEGDSFGIYNSVTDQFFGADPTTGKQWGVVDEGLDEEGKAQYSDSRVLTKWTWAYEYNTEGMDVPKEQSNRYCRNMTENGLDRVLTYKFEMPEDGNYVVEVGMACPWNNSSPVEISINGELLESLFIIQNTVEYCYTTVSPVDGYITVEATTNQPTINMAYIIISDVLTNEETKDWRHPETTAKSETDGNKETDVKPEDNATAKPADGNETNSPDVTTSAPAGNSGCGSMLGAVPVMLAAVCTVAVTFKKKRK